MIHDEHMPIISLWKPWANWVALGWKTIETRTHQRFAGLKGRRIGIHCALKWDDKALTAASDWLTVEQYNQTQNFLRTGGAVIATAYVADHRILNIQDEPRALIECVLTNRYGLILEDVQMIEAIPIKGKQGIFYLPKAFAEICDTCGKLITSHRDGKCYPDTFPDEPAKYE